MPTYLPYVFFLSRMLAEKQAIFLVRALLICITYFIFVSLRFFFSWLPDFTHIYNVCALHTFQEIHDDFFYKHKLFAQYVYWMISSKLQCISDRWYTNVTVIHFLIIYFIWFFEREKLTFFFFFFLLNCNNLPECYLYSIYWIKCIFHRF